MAPQTWLTPSICFGGEGHVEVNRSQISVETVGALGGAQTLPILSSGVNKIAIDSTHSRWYSEVLGRSAQGILIPRIGFSDGKAALSICLACKGMIL